MDVILLERIARLGQIGDTVKVKDGFARNFLLPKKKALRATKANREYFQAQKAQIEANNLKLKGEAEKIGNKLDALEEEIFEGRSEDVVRDLSNAKQEIINFRKVIRPQRPVLRDLENVKSRYLASDLDLEIYFDDIVDAHERIWDMLENYKEVVVALEETNESIISHKVNDILRVLTSISVIVLPLTLIASIFGMNVGLPGGGDPATDTDSHFFMVVGVMLVILIGMVAYFRKRHWL